MSTYVRDRAGPRGSAPRSERTGSGDRRCRHGVAFWAAAAIAFLVFAANAAASPLYRVYQAQFGFSATTLTAVVRGLHRRSAAHALVPRLRCPITWAGGR